MCVSRFAVRRAARIGLLCARLLGIHAYQGLCFCLVLFGTPDVWPRAPACIDRTREGEKGDSRRANLSPYRADYSIVTALVRSAPNRRSPLPHPPCVAPLSAAAAIPAVCVFRLVSHAISL